MILNVAVFAFDRTVTVAGTLTKLSRQERLRVIPPFGAGPLRVTVPVVLVPLVMVDGLTVAVVKTGAKTVRFPVAEPLPDAVKVTVVLVATGRVVILNNAVDEPEGTVRDAGTVATPVLLLESITLKPPAGARPFRVMVPFNGLVPTIEEGLIVMDLTWSGTTLVEPVTVTPL